MGLYELSVFVHVAAAVALLSGVYLASVANIWAQGWVQVSVAFWLVNSVVAGTVVKPAISRVAAQAAIAADGPPGQHLDALRWSPRWSIGADLITANDAAMLYVMTMKPGLAGSLLVVAATILLVAAARATGYAFRAPVMSLSQNSAEHGVHEARRWD